MRAGLDLARITSRAKNPKTSKWQTSFLRKANYLLARFSSGLKKAELTALCAREAYRRSAERNEYLSFLESAEQESHLANSLTHHIAGLCEVAEAAAECREFRLADRLLQEAKDKMPNAKNSRLGMKVTMVRPYLIADWLSSLAKATSRLPWAGEPQASWAKQASDRGQLNEVGQTHDSYQDALRAFAVAKAWRALFNQNAEKDVDALWQSIEETLQELADPPTKARALRDLAILEAYAGRTDHALRRIERLADGFDKDDVLHRVGAIFANRALTANSPPVRDVNQRAFLEVLPPSAEYFGSTYLMLARLVRLFPGNASDMHNILKRRGLLEISFISPEAG
jgi:hypothetical protein